MRNAGRDVFSFEDSTLDLTRGCVRNANGEIELRPKSFELLSYLVTNAGRLISKDELVNAVWPNVIVSDDSLAQCVSDVRHVLNDLDRRTIKTVPRRGYLFTAPVSVLPRHTAAGRPFVDPSDSADQEYSAEGALALGPTSSIQQGHLTTTRRLAAILAADVVGYSRLMGADEEGTYERFKAHLRELVDPKIREHHGRIVKTTGDGVLSEFFSVVDAVRCAGEIQRAMADRDLDLAEERRLRFRIGVNLGDVIVDGDDVYGDGVNIAARLEGLAAPGSICISGTVRDHIGDRLPYAFEDMGEQSVKNIARPVRVYALRSEAMAGLPTASSATSSSSPGAARRLSIVVLPFANLGNNPEQQYFADGITEDLTTDLSRLTGLLVISRNTAFTYRNKSIDTKRISRELGVRYVVEGRYDEGVIIF